MRTLYSESRVLLLAGGMLLAIFAATKTRAQGPLTPTGTPAPIYKTLDQLEPRTMLSSSNTPGSTTAVYRITQPGSYYLANNVLAGAARNGIEIWASNVTLDLNGFKISGLAKVASLNGIQFCASSSAGNVELSNVRIYNGSITDMAQGGIAVQTAVTVHQLVLENIRINECKAAGVNVKGRGFSAARCAVERSGNGTAGGFVVSKGGGQFQMCRAFYNRGRGYYVAKGNVVLTDCASSSNTMEGIYVDECDGRLNSCHADANKHNGISCTRGNYTLSECTASGNGTSGLGVSTTGVITSCVAENNRGSGIAGIGCVVIKDCVSIENVARGIFIDTGGLTAPSATVSNCIVNKNGDDGIYIFSNDFQILNNVCRENGESGIYAACSGGRIEGNTTYYNGHAGIQTNGSGCFVVKNRAGHNEFLDFSFIPVPSTGPKPHTTGPIVRTTGEITTTNPWANFSDTYTK